MARGLRSGYIHIDCSDFLDEIEDDDLLEEAKRRDLHLETIGDFEDIERAYEALLAGRIPDAIGILDRIVRPKWRSTKKCLEQYQKAQA